LTNSLTKIPLALIKFAGKLFLKSSLLISLSAVPILSHAQFLKKFDRQTVEEFSEDRNPALTKSMQLVSNTTNYLCLGVPASIIVKGLLSHDRSTVKKGLFIVETIGISTAITLSTKYIVNRERPFVNNPSVIKASDGGGPSFPSGHTSEAFATATALSIDYPKWYVIVPSFAWAGTVGFSRMYLGVHYPTDVIAGAIVGSGSAFLSYKLNKWIRAEKKRRKQVAIPE
jgi:undecaprenyl-diphosphatase